MKHPAVYFISNKNRTTIYIGVTSDLEKRMLEHKAGIGSSFAAKYNLVDLIYYEKHPSMIAAIEREKQLKNWHSKWKWNQAKSFNKSLLDLAHDWFTPDEIKTFREDMRKEYELRRRDPETSSG
ncbi:MAG: GIY-YIG nuclease family protein [Chitinophagaceae bacterium]|nr:GIY-YIG nuclease family protein [Chitinophagaceae bacterium]